MAQYEMNLRDYWRIVRRRRVLIISSTALISLFSLWFAKQKTPVYQATAAVRYEQATSLTGLLVEVLSLSPGNDPIETQTTIIGSYAVMEQVAKRLGRLPANSESPPVRESQSYTALVDSLAGQIKTTRVGGTNIIDITATSTTPREARDLANTVAQVYKGYAATLRSARLSEARQFIEQQLREVETRLKQTDERVWAFRDANAVISPNGESTAQLSLLTQLRGEIEKTRRQRSELEQAQAWLDRDSNSPDAPPVVVEGLNPSIARTLDNLAQLTIERNLLLVDLTDKHPRVQAINDGIHRLRAGLRREVAAQIAQFRTREQILNQQLDERFQKSREALGVELSLQRLQREAKINDDLFTLLKTRQQEAMIKEAEHVDEVTIVRPATEPTAPIGGRGTNSVLAGAMIGLLVGLVLAFVQETLDTSIGTIEDVEAYLEVPVLAIIPHLDPADTLERLIARPELAETDRDSLRRYALLITHFDPKSPVAEAYRTLRTNIQFARMDRPGKVFVMTSPTLQEGKTMTIANLALAMAQNRQKTLLLGANLRRPAIHRYFGIEREPGLSDVLTGGARWQDCIRTSADLVMGRFEMEEVLAAPELDSLHIIESGPIPPNPSELLSTPAFANFLQEVREQYHIVLIDTPPVLPVTDAAIVAGQVDGVILVYQAGKVGRIVLKRAKAHIESARGLVWGVVLNDVQPEVSGSDAYSHYYAHYYGEERASSEPEQPKRRAERLRATVAGLAGRWRKGGAGSVPPTPAAPETAAPAAPETAAPAAPEMAAPAAPQSRSERKRSRGIGLLVLVTAALAVGVGLFWMSRLGQHPASIDIPRLRPSDRPAPLASTSSPQLVPAPPVPTAAEASAATTSPAAVPPVGPAAQTRVPTESATPTPPSADGGDAAYAIEFGPFLSRLEADQVEHRLNQAGYPTTRDRQPLEASVYGVFIEGGPTQVEANALAGTLREQGFPDTIVKGSSEPFVVQVGEAAPLRAAVQLGEQLRRKGYRVRLSAQPGEAIQFVLRSGSFSEPQQATRERQKFAELGIPNHVVRIK